MQVQEESISKDIFDTFEVNNRCPSANSYSPIEYHTHNGHRIFLPYEDKEYYIIPDLVKDWFAHLCVKSIRNLGLAWSPPWVIDSSVQNRTLESQYQRFGITKIRYKSCGTAFMMHICLESGIDIRSAHI